MRTLPETAHPFPGSLLRLDIWKIEIPRWKMENLYIQGASYFTTLQKVDVPYRFTLVFYSLTQAKGKPKSTEAKVWYTQFILTIFFFLFHIPFTL